MLGFVHSLGHKIKWRTEKKIKKQILLTVSSRKEKKKKRRELGAITAADNRNDRWERRMRRAIKMRPILESATTVSFLTTRRGVH